MHAASARTGSLSKSALGGVELSTCVAPRTASIPSASMRTTSSGRQRWAWTPAALRLRTRASSLHVPDTCHPARLSVLMRPSEVYPRPKQKIRPPFGPNDEGSGTEMETPGLVPGVPSRSGSPPHRTLHGVRMPRGWRARVGRSETAPWIVDDDARAARMMPNRSPSPLPAAGRGWETPTKDVVTRHRRCSRLG